MGRGLGVAAGRAEEGAEGGVEEAEPVRLPPHHAGHVRDEDGGGASKSSFRDAWL